MTRLTLWLLARHARLTRKSNAQANARRATTQRKETKP